MISLSSCRILEILRESRDFFASEMKKLRVEKVVWTKSRGTESHGDLLSCKIQKQKVGGFIVGKNQKTKSSGY